MKQEEIGSLHLRLQEKAKQTTSPASDIHTRTLTDEWWRRFPQHASVYTRLDDVDGSDVIYLGTISTSVKGFHFHTIHTKKSSGVKHICDS
ncbi:hypothetical protein SNE40_003986 [Patella caerulea]|uniref:Uncharacterized protein n=1 Tax=Patella caerulea TaxID=87958 RepID=A0AAN8KAX7_PATCE